MKAAIAAIAALLTSLVGVAHAQAGAAPLPAWAETAWKRLADGAGLRVSRRLDPFLRHGDFDADGSQDLAVLVVHGKSGKQGIAFLLQGRQPVLVGAGVDFGNGGDDFSWMDLWQVEALGSRRCVDRGQAVSRRADALLVARESSASALIYFRNGRPRWRQLGD